MKFSRRMQRVGESATGRMTRREHELRAQGRDLVGFGAGEPHFDSPSAVRDAAAEALRAGLTRYTAVRGIPDLRAALAQKYEPTGAPWTPDNVIVTVGAKAALFELALALFDEGDEVLIPSPCWVSLPEQVRLAGAEPVLVPPRPGAGYALRAQPLIRAMTERTRAVLINSPCNPTGGRMAAPEMARLVAACAERGVVLISDETYEHFVYDGETHASAAAMAAAHPETVVVVGSFSKTWAMTGWRLGWAIGPQQIIGALEVVQSHATSNATTFVMHAALRALAEPASETALRVDEYQQRRDQMMAGLEAVPGVYCETPPGAFYAFANVSKVLEERDLSGSEDLAELLLEEAGVVVVPGEAFGDPSSIRLSYACSEETLSEGLRRIREALGP